MPVETIQEADRLTPHLAQWMERYLKNKDLIHKRIKQIAVSGDTLTLTYADRTTSIRIIPQLPTAQQALIPFASATHCSIVTYNTQENFEAFVRDWETYAKFKRHFSIYFVNPFSKQDKLWVLFPSSHHAITEPAALKPGLITIASTVDYTTISELSTILAEETA